MNFIISIPLDRSSTLFPIIEENNPALLPAFSVINKPKQEEEICEKVYDSIIFMFH
jgi:hypothetical protein